MCLEPLRSTGGVGAASIQERLSLLWRYKSAGELHNQILASLPKRELDDISRYVQLVPLRRGQILYEADASIACAYFLNSGLDSVIAIMKNGESTEVALTGRQGFLGSPLCLGIRSTPFRVLVQVPGEAFAIKAEVFADVVEANETLRELAARFIQAHTVQAMQTAACNRLHPVEQRLARWLLLAQDALGSGDIPLTHEFLAVILGVRRESVTLAIKILENSECLASRRGLLSIADRTQLEQCSCECYQVLRKEFDRLLLPRKTV
jgi:CRP-like cAMP-binding protein